MEPQDIAIVVIASVWAVSFIVLGILSWRYQKKHDAYREAKKDYQQRFSELEENADLDNILLPIKTNINLPEGENFYDIEHHVSLYITEKTGAKHKNKKRESRRMKRKEILEDYHDYYGIINMKDVYGLKAEYNKHKLADLVGDLYVTNKRILLRNKNDHEEIKLREINSCSQTLIYLEGEFVPGFAIVTDEDIYQFVNDDPTVIIIIRELLKKNKVK